MSKLNKLLLSGIFAASITLGTTQETKAQKQNVFPANPDIETNFNGLTMQDGSPVNASTFKDKILVIYFGTPYKSPSCKSFFGTQGLAFNLLKQDCPDTGNKLQPIFITPYVSGGVNEQNIKEAERFGFTVLRGSLNDVVKLGREYNVQYFDHNRDGIPDNHTNFMYVQNQSGENIVIINGNAYAFATAHAISSALKKDGFQPALTCGY